MHVHAIKCLKKGKIILLQTDTLWGLSCDAENENAVEMLYALKDRPVGKPSIILASDAGMLRRYCKFNVDVEKLKGISLILASKPSSLLCPFLISEGKVCARIPDSPSLIRLISEFGRPVVSTSANMSGQPSPASLSDVPQKLVNEACAIVSNPDLKKGSSVLPQPSTIIDISEPRRPKIARKGKNIEKIKNLI